MLKKTLLLSLRPYGVILERHCQSLSHISTCNYPPILKLVSPILQTPFPRVF